MSYCAEYVGHSGATALLSEFVLFTMYACYCCLFLVSLLLFSSGINKYERNISFVQILLFLENCYFYCKVWHSMYYYKISKSMWLYDIGNRKISTNILVSWNNQSVIGLQHLWVLNKKNKLFNVRVESLQEYLICYYDDE